LSFYGNWASGATIVLVETAVFAMAMLFSPLFTRGRSDRVHGA